MPQIKKKIFKRLFCNGLGIHPVADEVIRRY